MRICICQTESKYLETGIVPAHPDRDEVRRMMLRHARMQIEYKGSYVGIREIRKHISWYTAGYPGSAKLRGEINQVESLEEMERLITEKF